VRHAFGEHLICVDSQFLWSPCEAAEVDALRLDRSAEQTVRQEVPGCRAALRWRFLQASILSRRISIAWCGRARAPAASGSFSAGQTTRDRVRCSEFTAALSKARKISALEPFDETAHRAIMRCYAGRGSHARDRSLQGAHGGLRRELGVDPDLPTVEASQRSSRTAPPGRGARCPNMLCPEQLPYAVAVTDIDNHIVGWNRVAEEALGFSKAEISAAHRPNLCFPTTTRRSLTTYCAKPLQAGRWVGEVTLTAGWRTCRQRRVVAPLFGPEGEIGRGLRHGFAV